LNCRNITITTDGDNPRFMLLWLWLWIWIDHIRGKIAADSNRGFMFPFLFLEIDHHSSKCWSYLQFFFPILSVIISDFIRNGFEISSNWIGCILRFARGVSYSSKCWVHWCGYFRWLLSVV
jgi:hypothetical protein